MEKVLESAIQKTFQNRLIELVGVLSIRVNNEKISEDLQKDRNDQRNKLLQLAENDAFPIDFKTIIEGVKQVLKLKKYSDYEQILAQLEEYDTETGLLKDSNDLGGDDDDLKDQKRIELLDQRDKKYQKAELEDPAFIDNDSKPSRKRKSKDKKKSEKKRDSDNDEEESGGASSETHQAKSEDENSDSEKDEGQKSDSKAEKKKSKRVKVNPPSS